MTDGQLLLELEGVSRSYDSTGGGAAREVLRDVSLRLRQGESLAVIGPSGSGKSTLLNIIGALDRPSGGTVLLEGQDLFRLDDKGLARIRSRSVGFVFQLHHLLPQCTVLENVLVPTLAVEGGEEGAESPEQRARRLLERVGLSGHLGNRPAALSGGERQRVAVVRALINNPRLLLADEPTGSLDRANGEQLMDLLAELNRDEGVALIVVTHAEYVAARMERVLELCEGALREREAAS